MARKRITVLELGEVHEGTYLQQSLEATPGGARHNTSARFGRAGAPLIVKPSHELLALELAPGRWLSLRGLARAAAMSGDVATANRARATWMELWHSADSTLRAALSSAR